MGRIGCVGNLDSQVQYLLKRQRLAGNELLQRLAVEKLHGTEGLAAVFADFIDGANIWMAQGGSSTRLTPKAFECLGCFR